MTDFDRYENVSNKNFKLAVLAVLFIGTLVMVVLDCMDFFQKWG